MYLILHKEFWKCGTIFFLLFKVNVKLQFPVVFNKFIQPISMSIDEFFPQWRALANPPLKLQEVVCILNICRGFWGWNYSVFVINMSMPMNTCMNMSMSNLNSSCCFDFPHARDRLFRSRLGSVDSLWPRWTVSQEK